MEIKIVKRGWVVLTPTVFQGDVMAWAESGEGDDDEEYPIVFDTPEEAMKEVAECMVIELQQFIDGERELEATSFGTDDYVALYEQDEDGNIYVHDEEGNPIIETTLQEWRENR